MAEVDFVMICAITADIPLEKSIVPSVAINGGSLHFATRNPLRRPNNKPIITMSGITAHELCEGETLHIAPATTEDEEIIYGEQ